MGGNHSEANELVQFQIVCGRVFEDSCGLAFLKQTVKQVLMFWKWCFQK